MNREYAEKLFREGIEIMEGKNHDYTGKVDNIAMTGIRGVAVRLLDKAARINTLVDKKEKVTDESIRDTFIDIMNYGNIGLQLLDGKWNTSENIRGDTGRHGETLEDIPRGQNILKSLRSQEKQKKTKENTSSQYLPEDNDNDGGIL